jgi:predicted ATP-dependent endonuclease of OLD family
LGISANNTGKSWLCRQLLTSIGEYPYGYLEDFRGDFLEILIKHKNDIFLPFSIENATGKTVLRIDGYRYFDLENDYNRVISDLSNDFNISTLNSVFLSDRYILNHISNIEELESRKISIESNGNEDDYKNYSEEYSNYINHYRNNFKDLIDLYKNHIRFTHTQFSKIYIPNVRTLRNYSNHENFGSLISPTSIITDNTKSKYFNLDTTNSNTIKINDGQNLYSEFFTKRNSTNDNLEKIKKYQDFLSDVFFEGQNIEIITDFSQHQLKIKIGDEAERLIHDLGDGLQQVIILTFPLFFEDCGVIVVEEPEMWLHAGFQKLIVELYANDQFADRYGYSKDFIFFLITHSNHILDTSISPDSISIFSLQKQLELDSSDSKLILRRSYGSDMAILDSLGVTNASVFLANCAIWVEGVTDRLY